MSIFDGVTADAVRWRREITDGSIQGCRREMMNDAAALPVTRMVMDLAIPEQLGEVLTYLIERDQPRR